MSDKNRRRLNRQLNALANRSPALGKVITFLTRRLGVHLRVALAILLIAGGFLWFLPVLGLWMLPLGLLLLAFDMPILRPAVLGAILYFRRYWAKWRRRWQSRRGAK